MGYRMHLSVISYGISTWGGAAKSYMLQLERAQRAESEHFQTTTEFNVHPIPGC